VLYMLEALSNKNCFKKIRIKMLINLSRYGCL